MANPTRGGYVFNITSSGFTPDNPSIRRRTGQSDTKLVSFGFGFLEYIKYYGDELTWEQLALAKLTWGNEKKIRFSTVREGWTYIYKCREHLFVVIDDNDNVRYKVMTYNISTFGIIWEIFTSHQFYLLYANPPSDDVFLIGWIWKKHWGKFDPDNPAPPINPDNPSLPDYSNYPQAVKSIEILAMYVDQYYSINEYKITDINRLISVDIPLDILINRLKQGIYEPQKPPSILRTYNPVINITGNYDAFMIKRGEDISSGAISKERKGNIAIEPYITFLLALLSASLYNRGKPVYEPWMLWWMWKWLGSASPVNVVDVIFDIMPNWGA